MKAWRQTSIRGLLIATALFAAFALGYQDGSEHADEFFFQELMRLINDNQVPDEWEGLGGSSTMAPYPQNISICLAADPGPSLYSSPNPQPNQPVKFELFLWHANMVDQVSWDFGDGNTRSGYDSELFGGRGCSGFGVRHTFTEAGEFTVRVTFSSTESDDTRGELSESNEATLLVQVQHNE